jgi:hypothetical protein
MSFSIGGDIILLLRYYSIGEPFSPLLSDMTAGLNQVAMVVHRQHLKCKALALYLLMRSHVI